MFSKKMVIVAVVIVLLFLNLTILTVTSKWAMSTPGGIGKVFVPVVAPFQKAVIHSIRSVKGVWKDYFFLVSVSKENRELKNELHISRERNNLLRETELFNSRLREHFKFKDKTRHSVIAAEVISKDSSIWFKTIIIDKGSDHNVKQGLPVVVPEGIAGQVIDVASGYSKVLLIIDRNSAVDALVQRTRARGIIKGESDDYCYFKYALRKLEIKEGDIIVSSGLDGVYPKGLRLGRVSNVLKKDSGIFQDVKVEPFVDFERLEEVLIVLDAEKG